MLLLLCRHLIDSYCFVLAVSKRISLLSFLVNAASKNILIDSYLLTVKLVHDNERLNVLMCCITVLNILFV